MWLVFTEYTWLYIRNLQVGTKCTYREEGLSRYPQRLSERPLHTVFWKRNWVRSWCRAAEVVGGLDINMVGLHNYMIGIMLMRTQRSSAIAHHKYSKWRFQTANWTCCEFSRITLLKNKTHEKFQKPREVRSASRVLWNHLVRRHDMDSWWRVQSEYRMLDKPPGSTRAGSEPSNRARKHCECFSFEMGLPAPVGDIRQYSPLCPNAALRCAVQR